MIFLYIGSIVLFIIVAFSISIFARKKQQKRIQKLNNKQEESSQEVFENTDLNLQAENSSIEEMSKDSEKESEIKSFEQNLEDFALDKDEELQFQIPDNEDEDELDRKFAEYQKFLRENLDMDEDSMPPEIRTGFEDSDYGEFLNKSPDEIDEILKNSSPQTREILLSNVFARKEFEEDDENDSD